MTVHRVWLPRPQITCPRRRLQLSCGGGDRDRNNVAARMASAASITLSNGRRPQATFTNGACGWHGRPARCTVEAPIDCMSISVEKWSRSEATAYSVKRTHHTEALHSFEGLSSRTGRRKCTGGCAISVDVGRNPRARNSKATQPRVVSKNRALAQRKVFEQRTSSTARCMLLSVRRRVGELKP